MGCIFFLLWCGRWRRSRFQRIGQELLALFDGLEVGHGTHGGDQLIDVRQRDHLLTLRLLLVQKPLRNPALNVRKDFLAIRKRRKILLDRGEIPFQFLIAIFLDMEDNAAYVYADCLFHD